MSKGTYVYFREYDRERKKTIWAHPSGEMKTILTLNIILYDAQDLLLDGIYTSMKEVSVSIDLGDNEKSLMDETLIDTHLKVLLQKLERQW
ncbi:MAG: hypothetical protein EOM67_09195 [Spirochaetia bacterium]|nr:hypothetical protein [Spirochaetia bacterium]